MLNTTEILVKSDCLKRRLNEARRPFNGVYFVTQYALLRSNICHSTDLPLCAI